VRASTAVAVALVAALLAGCGGERSFDAESVVEELNAAGAGLELGGTLTTTEDGTEVRILSLSEPTGGDGDHAEEPESAEEHGHDHGAGALTILDDSERGVEEYERCETAPAFVCFRAANAVLRFTAMTPEEQARISSAVAALETE
jgi:hypothetical protein